MLVSQSGKTLYTKLYLKIQEGRKRRKEEKDKGEERGGRREIEKTLPLPPGH